LNSQPPLNGNGHGNGGRAAKPRRARPRLLVDPGRLPGIARVVSKFGAPFGKRFTRNHFELLRLAYSAYAGLKRSATLVRERGANIYTQWTGDPDAFGSAIMLSAIFKKLGASQVHILTGALGHPQNVQMARLCGLEFFHPNEGRIADGLACMVDASPPLGARNTTGVEPERDFFFVADHHTGPEEVERLSRDRGVRSIRHAYVGLPVGSTSAFMASIGLAFGVWDDIGPKGRAAAALGIYTDTSALLHGATALDFRMFEKLTRDEETRDLLGELRDYRVPAEWYMYKSISTQWMMSQGAVKIAPIGRVPDEHRDVIAEIASDLLRVEGTSLGIAVAWTDRGTEVSVRADSRLLGYDKDRIIRVVEHLLDKTFPGLSGFKYERRPPYRVEGGACVRHNTAEDAAFHLTFLDHPVGYPELDHCRGCARALLSALTELKFQNPEEIQGLI
jgi:nanoRNase/pAp phosphatase (c-di-AMP/oligoRNAs hydrolase)